MSTEINEKHHLAGRPVVSKPGITLQATGDVIEGTVVGFEGERLQISLDIDPHQTIWLHENDVEVIDP